MSKPVLGLRVGVRYALDPENPKYGTVIERVLDHYFIYDKEQDRYFCSRTMYHDSFLPRLMEVVREQQQEAIERAAKIRAKELLMK